MSQLRLSRLDAPFGVEVHGEGCYIEDHTGRRYLDCLGGYGTFALGHRHPAVVAAVRDQLDSLAMSGKAFSSKPAADLASELARKAAGSHELRERLMADYNAVLSEAATIDAQDEKTEDRGIEGAIADSRLVMRRRTSELG